jgi:hypothetical protein
MTQIHRIPVDRLRERRGVVMGNAVRDPCDMKAFGGSEALKVSEPRMWRRLSIKRREKGVIAEEGIGFPRFISASRPNH